MISRIHGRAALGAASRSRAFGKAKAVCDGLAMLDTRWLHLVDSDRELTEPERAQLEQMLTYGPEVPAMAPGSLVSAPAAAAPQRAQVWIAPRLGTTSPWSSKATDIAHVCGLAAVTRIERAIEYTLHGVGIDAAAVGRALSDRMTETVVVREDELARVIAHGGEPRPLGHVPLGRDGAATLRAASARLGLALADDEIEYLVARYGELGRDPTDVELMMFAQANSEHCRHKIFNAEWHLDGVRQERSLFQLIKRSTEVSPGGVLSAYKDNAAVVEGSVAERLVPGDGGVYRAVKEPSHILGKVETHNHPTAISPFPGAATGSGGEIRDEGATGRGAKPKAGLVGFTVSDLRIPGALEPWEAPAAVPGATGTTSAGAGAGGAAGTKVDPIVADELAARSPRFDGPISKRGTLGPAEEAPVVKRGSLGPAEELATGPSRSGAGPAASSAGRSGASPSASGASRPPWIGSPARIASALDIMIDGPLGGAAFNNEFGRPAILGYFRTFEHDAGGDGPRVARGYHKPVMLAGGIGAIRPGHVAKAPVPPGAALIVLGGPAFLIGLGGGAASSLAQGASAEDLDFASVQRDNAEIQRRCQEVIDRCWALGDRNPVLSIHDVGAGGLSNALPELVHDAGLGARLELRAIPSGEPDLSPLELWSNESQERYVMAIAPDRVADFAALCARERAPWAQLGTAAADGRLVLADARGGPPPVDLPLEVVLGKPPRMVRRAETVAPPRAPLALGGATVAEALHRVLGLPAVADKTFLVAIGDRTVGGLVARDPMVGPHQVPVADCALTTAGFDTCAGEVMSLGERPPVAALDAAAASRLAIGEAITNLAAAPIGALGRIKLSCNWMAAAGHPGEDAALYAAVRAASETAVALGIAIPVGKDSMSMRTVWTPSAGSVSHAGGPATPSPRDAGSPLSPDAVAGATLAALEREVSAEPAGRSVDRDDAELAALGRAAQREHDLDELARLSRAPSGEAARREAIAGYANARIDAAVAGADAIAERVATAGTAYSAGGAAASALGARMTGAARGAAAAADRRTVVSPVTLVVTAFGPVTDVRLAVTPELRGGGRELLLVELGRGRLGGSCLAQVYGQLGDAPPDLDDPRRLAGFFDAIQRLVADRRLAAYHDRSDGGLVVAALEMAFAAGLGLDLDTTAVHSDPFAALFAEELGALIEVAAADVAEVRAALTAAGAQVHAIGRAVAGDRIRIAHAGATVVDTTRGALRARWSHVTHQIALRRDDPACAAEEHAARVAPDAPGLTAHLTFDLAAPPPAVIAGARPRVAILREQGVNGQIEMAGAFTRAGFDAVDVHMTDLVEGRTDLADCRGVVACGGFSFGDVLGGGRGWAATFRYNARARDALARFLDRRDTFVLGVCNGCQMLADLADRLPGAERWPRFVRNRSDRFEARLVLLRIEDTPSLFFRGMAGSRIPVANAHGEGRADLTADQLAALDHSGLVAARFVDGRGEVATAYPANPNGSPAGIAALTTPDGRLTIMMPHPERVFRTVQMSWHPADWPEDSPWMRMFHNARAWVG